MVRNDEHRQKHKKTPLFKPKRRGMCMYRKVYFFNQTKIPSLNAEKRVFYIAFITVKKVQEFCLPGYKTVQGKVCFMTLQSM